MIIIIGHAQEGDFVPLDVLYWVTFFLIVVDLGCLNMRRHGDC